MDVGKLTATLSLNISQFTKSIGEAVKQVQNVGSNMNNSVGGNARRNIDNTNNSVRALTGSFKDLDRIVSGILISQLFYNSVNAIQDATASVVHFKNEMEKAQIAMEYFLGTAERAQGFIMNMKDFAAVTAFSTEQALVLSRKLMGAQFRPEQIRTVMEILNDANAATGATAEQMDRIVLALTQIKTSGRLAGQEVRQLAEAGIPIYKLLQEQLGLTGEELRNLGDLAIDGDRAVLAILNGLQQRYAGAAEKIANTIPGMWETIQDNMLMISERLFDGPYRALEGFLRRWRDGLEAARAILTEKGLGGVFEHFIPPELQSSIRNVIGSFKSLAGSVKILYDALKPVASMLAGSIIKVLGQVLPVVASIVRVVAQLTAAIIQANPWIKGLIAAIMGLMVAGAAAKALMFLWSVTRMGVICTVVAQAVMILTRSIQALFLVLSRNPITGLVILVAGALMYLAMSSKTVTQWMDRMTAKLGQLSGINMGEILQPEDGKSLEEWTQQFNESLEQMNEEMKAIGVNADKAGKKVKDKFVASFDELYQVPDQLDEIGGGLGDIGNMPDLPALPVSGLPDLSLPDMKGDMDLPGVPAVGRPPRDGGGGDGGEQPPQIPPPDTSPALAALAIVAAGLAATREALRGWVEDTGKAIAAWAIDVTAPVVNWVTETSAAIATWIVDTAASIGGWVADTALSFSTWAAETTATLVTWITDNALSLGNWIITTGLQLNNWVTQGVIAIGLWAVNTGAQISSWVRETAGNIGSWAVNAGIAVATWAINGIANIRNWATNTAKSVSTWASNTASTVITWVSNVGTNIASWATNAANSIGTWATTTINRISTWVTTTGTNIATWISNTSSNISNWVTSTGTNIGNWVTTTGTNIGNWVTNTSSNISKWVSNTITNIGNWVTTTGTNIATWISNTSNNLYNWGMNTGANIATWVNNTSTNIGTWVATTSTNIANWVTGTATSIGNWVTATAQNMANWANAGLSAVNSWASSTWGTMNNWLSGTANNIANWASSTISNIVSWAQSAWSTIKGLASAVGQEVGSWFGAAKDSITNTYQAASEWVGEHKAEIIAGAAVAAVVAAGIATVATGGAAAPALAAALVAAPVALGASGALGSPNASIPQYATGTIVDYDHIARVGEGGRREAIIPLENSTYMRPFSAAVANDLFEMLAESFEGGSRESDPRPILYVANLIADDRGLKELERRLEIIRISESQRKGL